MKQQLQKTLTAIADALLWLPRLMAETIYGIAADKLQHFLVALLLSFALRWLLFLLTPLPLLACAALALMLVLLAGALKEAYDAASGTGYPEWGDVLANMLGALLGAF